MNTQFNRFLYFSVQRFRREPVQQAYVELSESIQYDEKKLIKIQQQRLVDLLQYAILHVPYYENVYTAYKDSILNLELDQVYALFEKLPVLTKRKAIENYNSLQSPADIVTHNNISSGTTGEPFQFPCDNASWAYRHASIMRFIELHGVRFGDAYGYFSGQHWRNELRYKTVLKDMFFNRKRLSAFSVTEETVQNTYNWLLKHKATYIFGYPSTIVDFARVSTELLNLDLRKLSIRFILATGETLETTKKEYLERVYGCVVGNYYGSVEGAAGAFEGPDGYMHENMETTYFYTGENGKIFLTDLFLRKMPLIKFDIGDYASNIEISKSSKPSHRIVGNIVGRSGEKIKLPDGKEAHPMVLNYFFDLFTENFGIRRFRFVFGKEKITLLLVPIKKTIEPKDISAIEKELKSTFKGVLSEVKVIEDLPTLSNGKHKDWVYA